MPYVVDSIRRNLQRDFRTFNLAAVGVFALVIVALFRSLPILLGSLTACATAAFATLMAQQWLGGRIGLLTANIVTIAFVLTQSHVVFMSNNWRKWRASSATPEEAVRRAIRPTRSPPRSGACSPRCSASAACCTSRRSRCASWASAA